MKCIKCGSRLPWMKVHVAISSKDVECKKCLSVYQRTPSSPIKEISAILLSIIIYYLILKFVVPSLSSGLVLLVYIFNFAIPLLFYFFILARIRKLEIKPPASSN